ncbi:hypothetical protein KFU94_62325 [Chloroflexi bacterium TSY]|nr:hypothetical protein [Chloroflexi bacterium TSY]
MDSVKQFLIQYETFGFDFSKPISSQKRIYDSVVLSKLPPELKASYNYRSGSRGRPNLNQTRTHSQCATCKRVLRNDAFHTPPSLMARNVIYSHCKECTQEKNSERYALTSTEIRTRHHAILSYLAPRCTYCGFDQHGSAMDLHHPQEKGGDVMATLVATLASEPTHQNMDKLLREARQCTPLCSNCHRMLHAGAIELPVGVSPLKYHLAELVRVLNRHEKENDFAN